MIPKVKKSIKKFIMSESGAVSKQSLLKMGVITIFVTASGSQIVNASQSCGGPSCNKLYSDCDEAYDCVITDDMVIIFQDEELYGKTANIFDDQPGWHVSETGAGAHSNIWLCDNECKALWAYSDHENQHTYSWACVDTVTTDDEEHWNAAHHRNDLGLSSEDSLRIKATHGNQLFFVDKTIYPYDYCGADHTSHT